MRKLYLLFCIFIISSGIYAQPKLIHRNLIAPFLNTYVGNPNFYDEGVIHTYYVFGATNTPNCMMSLDTSFQINWEKTIYVEGQNSLEYVFMNDNAVDGPDNIYQVFHINNTTEEAIARIDHNGVVQWAKKHPIGANNLIVSEMKAKDNYLYLMFSEVYTSPNQTIMKMDNNGNIQWQKRFFTSGTELIINDMKIDDEGNIYLYGIESSCFFNMMIKPDGSIAYANKQCTGIVTETGLLKYGEPIRNGRSIFLGQLLQGGLTTGLVWAATDTNGIINSFSMYADSNIYYDAEGIGRTTDNTVLLSAFRFDSTTALDRSLWLEVDSTGYLLSAQSRLGDSLHIYEMQVNENNMVVTAMYGGDNLGYFYTSDKSMSLCRPFTNFGNEVINRNPNTFLAEHNISSIDNTISFTPTNVWLSDTVAIQLTELCALHLSIEEDEILFKLCPNPITDYIVIEGEKNIDRLECLTMEGTIVKTLTNASTELILPMEDLAPGIYLIRLTSGNYTSVKKIIKL
jgi:hypothetical protein